MGIAFATRAPGPGQWNIHRSHDLRILTVNSMSSAASSSSAFTIARASKSFDAHAVASQICRRGYCIVDGFFDSPAVTPALLYAIQSLDDAGKMRLGKVHKQAGTDTIAANDQRSDRIAFLPSERQRQNGVPAHCSAVEDVADSLCEYTVLADALRAQLSNSADLVARVGGSLDDCTFMCAVYPGEGAKYIKHRDAEWPSCGIQQADRLVLSECAVGGRARRRAAPIPWLRPRGTHR